MGVHEDEKERADRLRWETFHKHAAPVKRMTKRILATGGHDVVDGAAANFAKDLFSNVMKPGDGAYVCATSRTEAAFLEGGLQFFKNRAFVEPRSWKGTAKCWRCFCNGQLVVVLDPAIVGHDPERYGALEGYLINELESLGAVKIDTTSNAKLKRSVQRTSTGAALDPATR